MRNVLLPALLCGLLLCPPAARGQECAPFAYKKAFHTLYRQLLHGDRFELFSDNYRKQEVFADKRDFRAYAFLQCVPVQKINPDTLPSTAVYVADASALCAFLFRKDELTSIVRATQRDCVGRAYAGRYLLGKEGRADPPALYAASLDPAKCLFFDNTFHRFCYAQDGRYYCWKDEAAAFVLLGDATDVKREYRRYAKQP